MARDRHDESGELDHTSLQIDALIRSGLPKPAVLVTHVTEEQTLCNASSTRHEHGDPLQQAIAQLGEGIVGLFEREDLALCFDQDSRRQVQKGFHVMPGEIGDRSKRALTPEDVLREAWMSLM